MTPRTTKATLGAPTGGRALVTGGASGLGLAMVERYAREGWRVLVTDIDEAGLATVQNRFAALGTVVTRRLDVRDDADWERARQWVLDTWGGLDLLVNNAGVAAGGRMERFPMDDWDWILELNLKSVIRGCRTFIPMFKQQGAGHIVNVASLAGIAHTPMMTPYNTTKGAVISLSQTLRYELKPYGIGVSVLCPGFVKTNLGASMRSPDQATITMANKLIDNGTVSAEQVADQVFAAVRSDRYLVLTHREGRLINAVKRISPALLERVIVGRWSRIRSRIDATDEAGAAGTSTAQAKA